MGTVMIPLSTYTVEKAEQQERERHAEGKHAAGRGGGSASAAHKTRTRTTNVKQNVTTFSGEILGSVILNVDWEPYE
jgi:hypothetical protein